MAGATVLFLPYPSTSGSWGSVMNLVALAQECRGRGDRAVFHACPPTAELLRRQGFEVLPVEGVPPRETPRAVDTFYDVCTALGFDDRAFWDRVLRSEEEAVQAVRPDALVSHMRLTAPITAARHGIPLASCGGWSTDPRVQASGTHPLDEMAGQLASTWSALTVRSISELVFWRADLRMVTSVPIFEPDFVDLPNTLYTGYLRPMTEAEPPWSRPVPDRLVLAYASNAPWGVPRVVEALATAAERAGAVLWCVARAGGPTGRVSAHCEVFSYLPFEALLGRAGAVVFHGGQATALASLCHGVPALAVPGRHYERRYNATRLAELGTSVTGDLAVLRPSRLATILQRLLDDDDIRSAAASAHRSTYEHGGVVSTVDAIHRLIGC
ncbi:hypothetical protein C6361_24045 [Plantactinospora sp. BC1]|uniref:glycosyltransferase n=1 Tax=Plantactinospora sp. BC1 TaxID=2108470 RepID=UPI000D155B06|nr:nucleotide disphospho-sugar-binding domain-containing protein [Plantactinospora sp. BC1]AVT32037.1 hypothetical protein C6361_24045 [Plantactinospora sp. BC1]